MDFGNILNQVLGTIQKSTSGSSTTETITKVGGGAAVAGILSMILGRNGGSSLAKMGSLAALGSLAYEAYKNYQKANSATQQEVSAQSFEQNEQTVEANVVILRTMIAAALSDGEIDEKEKQVIAAEMNNNPELAQWLEQEIETPATVADIAKNVGNNTALAAQVYLAARMVCNADLSRKEIVFLSQLAEALKLEDSLVEQLEKQAGF